MAAVFVLGPSEWEPSRGGAKGATPRAIRESLRDRLAARGHDAFIMETERDDPGEDLVEKFERLLDERKVDEILVYWPPKAKMQTTYDELILLRARLGRKRVPRIWVAHHERVAEIRRGEFKVLETGGRSRYLSAVARLGVAPLAWSDEDELSGLMDLLAAEFERG